MKESKSLLEVRLTELQGIVRTKLAAWLPILIQDYLLETKVKVIEGLQVEALLEIIFSNMETHLDKRGLFVYKVAATLEPYS